MTNHAMQCACPLGHNVKGGCPKGPVGGYMRTLHKSRDKDEEDPKENKEDGWVVCNQFIALVPQVDSPRGVYLSPYCVAYCARLAKHPCGTPHCGERYQDLENRCGLEYHV